MKRFGVVLSVWAMGLAGALGGWAPVCLVPGLMETIKPGRTNDGGTQEVPRGVA
jgi:hypothetical protein